MGKSILQFKEGRGKVTDQFDEMIIARVALGSQPGKGPGPKTVKALSNPAGKSEPTVFHEYFLKLGVVGG